MDVDRFIAVFEQSVRVEGGCREWTGIFDRYGYARYSGRGAYRLAYEQFVGEIPAGLTVDHMCFNPRCVEPSHLRLLTRAQNGRNTRARRRDCRACIRARVAAYQARRAAA
jgi:hypothetical protein